MGLKACHTSMPGQVGNNQYIWPEKIYPQWVCKCKKLQPSMLPLGCILNEPLRIALRILGYNYDPFICAKSISVCLDKKDAPKNKPAKQKSFRRMYYTFHEWFCEAFIYFEGQRTNCAKRHMHN